jgi:hypothetical protein
MNTKFVLKGELVYELHVCGVVTCLDDVISQRESLRTTIKDILRPSSEDVLLWLGRNRVLVPGH